MSAPCLLHQKPFPEYTRTGLKSRNPSQNQRLSKPPIATVFPSAERDTDQPKFSNWFSTIMSVPRWLHSGPCPLIVLTDPVPLFPFGLQIATVSPSAEKLDWPKSPCSSFPSMSAPSWVHSEPYLKMLTVPELTPFAPLPEAPIASV